MKNLLRFYFFTLYKFYSQRWDREDPEDFALPVLCGWIYSIIIFFSFLICNLMGIDYHFWEDDQKLKYLLFIPGFIILFNLWRKLISNDGYKEWINPELYQEPMYNGQRGTLLFWGLFLVPVILAMAMGLTMPG